MTIAELEQEILVLTNAYFDRMDEDISDEFQIPMIESAIDNYKCLRDYPEYYTDEMIEADVIRYFSRRKNHIAFEVVPEIYGRMGSEGLALLTDAGTVRQYKNLTTFADVTPICEVV